MSPERPNISHARKASEQLTEDEKLKFGLLLNPLKDLLKDLREGELAKQRVKILVAHKHNYSVDSLASELEEKFSDRAQIIQPILENLNLSADTALYLKHREIDIEGIIKDLKAAIKNLRDKELANEAMGDATAKLLTIITHLNYLLEPNA